MVAASGMVVAGDPPIVVDVVELVSGGSSLVALPHTWAPVANRASVVSDAPAALSNTA